MNAFKVVETKSATFKRPKSATLKEKICHILADLADSKQYFKCINYPINFPDEKAVLLMVVVLHLLQFLSDVEVDS